MITAKPSDQTAPKVVLITGAARRIGKAIAQFLHAQGMRVIIHYRSSANEANRLCAKLNQQREHSAIAIAADLNQPAQLSHLIEKAIACWGHLDVLINNASTFYPTPVGHINEAQWSTLMDSNLKAPFFLSQLAAPWLKERKGSIINITDIHAERPLKNYTVYCISKAGLFMMTRSLAKELGPEIRVNAVAPGHILWPEKENILSDTVQREIVARTALKRSGTTIDIAKAVLFFINSADYVTGQVLSIDGGRLLNC